MSQPVSRILTVDTPTPSLASSGPRGGDLQTPGAARILVFWLLA